MAETTARRKRQPRWAILWDAHARTPKPVGLVVEHPEHVHVYLPPQFAIPKRYSGPYRVMLPEGVGVIYKPGDEGYFDQVLLDLSRVFAVGKQGTRPELDLESVLDLYIKHVAQDQPPVPTEQRELARPSPSMSQPAVQYKRSKRPEPQTSPPLLPRAA